MKIVVIGGTGLIGRQVVAMLAQQGHETVAASPSNGVNAVTGEGVAQALSGAQVVVDVSNSPSFEVGPVMAFFSASTRNLLEAAKEAGVGHYVALSVVGTEKLQESGYFRAKLVQEDLLKAAGLPYTILRATQFFEFIGAIIQSTTVGDAVHAPVGGFQPVAAADVAAVVADIAVSAPLNTTVEVGGPEQLPMRDLLQRALRARGDSRPVLADPAARYFGVRVDSGALTAGDAARIGPTRLDDWLKTQPRR